MSITNWIVLFIVFWFTLYGVVYYYFMTMPGASLSFDGNSIESFVSNIHNTVDKSIPQVFEQQSHSGVELDLNVNPFLSNSCKVTTENLKKPPRDSISIVIPVHNEDHAVLLRTLKSLIQNSHQELKSIVLVDVHSAKPVSNYHDITGLSGKIHVVRSERLIGLAGARHMGAKYITSSYSSVFSNVIPADHMLVFMSSHGVVSNDWLIPLYNTVNPEATPGYGLDSDTTKANIIATPSIDIWDKKTGDFIPSDENIVPGFTWGLGFRWEPLVDEQKHASKRIISSNVDIGSSVSNNYKDQAKYAPITSGVFGITINFYTEIGGFDTSLDTVPTDKDIADGTDFTVDRGGNDESVGIHSYYWSNDDISDLTLVEFSLRVWMCGGPNTAIVHQPCSRVANAFSSVLEEGLSVGSPDSGGITQRIVDHSVMRVADYWFRPGSYRDVIYQARFMDRLAYTITDISAQLRSPELLYKLPNFASEQCLSIEWYLKEIYPGLLHEADTVRQVFSNQYIGRKQQIEKAYKPLTDQYHKETVLTNINAGEVDEMKLYALADRKLGKSGMTVGRGGQLTKQEIIPKITMTEEDKQKISMDSHENHVNMVRDEGICVDQPTTWDRDDCSIRASHGECDSNPSYMMFGCPKSCGFCDEKTNELCTDYYLKKCPKWAEEGLCSANAAEMDIECRRSCGLCRRRGDPEVHLNGASKANPVADAVPAAPIVNAIRTDPYVAQRQFHDGLLPDPVSPDTGASTKTMCQMSGRPNGNLLDRVHISSPKLTPPKIFCGIYTMESKHRDNVQATRETWAKKCTGFVAFSTADDPTIPAMSIQHEGVEAYENMWQKSKSIWQYIGTHYVDDFDYFLMGGDDMFYIIENLMEYLGSDEIVAATKDSKYGIYLGRKFSPPKQSIFNSGGAGYVLDKKAVRLLHENLHTPKCFPHQVGFWEDVNIANCLRVSSENTILPYDTRDSMGRERFHPFSPGQHLTYGLPTLNPNDWYVKYNPELKVGIECCSEQSVSFHYIGAELMKQLHAYTYHCPTKPK